MYPKRSKKDAIATMITGFLCIPIFKFGITKIPDTADLFNKMDVMLPSFLLAMLAGYIASKLDKQNLGLINLICRSKPLVILLVRNHLMTSY